MSAIKLVIGDKSKSSWSLRAWLFLKHHDVPFTEQLIRLDQPDTRENILELSPSGRVPLLIHGGVYVWESIAICEYAAETFALPAAWPMIASQRAFARAIAAEMHAGFGDLRRELPFDANRAPERARMSAAAEADIRRIRAIWREARPKSKPGRWLLGPFGIVDAMFAPVAVRLQRYAVEIDGPEREYMELLLEHPQLKAWIDGAAADLAEQKAAAEKAAAQKAAVEQAHATAEAAPARPKVIANIVPTALARPAPKPAPAAAPHPAPPPAAPPAPAAAPPAPVPPAASAPAPAPSPTAAEPAPPATRFLATPAAAPVATSPMRVPDRVATPIADVEPITDPKLLEAAAAELAAMRAGKTPPVASRPATPIADPEPAKPSSGPPTKVKSVILPPD